MPMITYKSQDPAKASDMIKLVGLVLVIFSSMSSASLRDCLQVLPEFGIRISVPDEQRLDEICPPIVSYVNCFGKEMNKTPEDFDEFNHRIFNGLSGFVKEMCQEGSEIRRDYLSNLECFRELDTKFDSCLEEAKQDYRAFVDGLDSQGQDLPHEYCLLLLQSVLCMAQEALNLCGTSGQSTYLVLVKRSMYLTKFCTEDLHMMYQNPLLQELHKRFNYTILLDE